MGVRSRPHLAVVWLAVVMISSSVVQMMGAQFDLKKLIKDAEEVKEKAEVIKEVKRFLPISTDEEVKIGKGVAARLQQTYGIHRDERVERYVALVGTAVSWQGERKEIAYSFTILDSDEVNAFAAPGGYVMITRGLLSRMKNEAELACVLGHEIWHVEARHEMKRVQQAQIAGTLANTALSAMSKQELIEVTDLCYTILEKGRSREVELEADVKGVGLAAQVGYAPSAMEHLLARLKREPREGPLSKLWATHPDMDERGKELRSKYGHERDGALLAGRFETTLASLHNSR
jgi:beta-barrel assembly-enhancing protease